ncbi:radical SAM superfamily enzyme YgiQ (UPF0313 family) [Tumebacillus sp. BK434]|uniref:B12-binding domain-containing radical SAM protein n=1 Tax=Tumebacillus sp. BK434 TaxID=2512169 RepID=UPI0010496157|nr:radical SAM protein [Tumebacillus sp. BK434]TCP55938.1 radical SAM superfamily enzyme YgiQ (UPF0313 family) [Tumebacillus sp. BK434]
MSKVMLVFPPTTEARLFPYLSLPMITAYLRRQGVEVGQYDFNLDVCHRLFSKQRLREFLQESERTSQGLLKEEYRAELARYLLEHHDRLWQDVIEKKSGSVRDTAASLPFVRQGVELLLEGSVLREELTSLEKIAKRALEFELAEEPAAYAGKDPAATELYERLRETLLQEQPDVFAVSVAYYSQLLPTLLLARWVKELRPQTFVIVGGQQMMLRGEQICAIPAFVRHLDGIGLGAGEETMDKLMQALAGQLPQAEVPDFVWLQQGQIGRRGPRSTVGIQQVPTPDFAGLNVKGYLHEEFHFGLTTCVGCYYGRCVFCSYGNRSRREGSYQQKTARQLARECRELIETYGVTRINFVDENTNLRLVKHAMRLLREQGYTLQFTTRNRLEECLLDEAFVQELKELGCVLMSAGYETNSQRLLDKLDKGVQASHYQPIIDNLHRAGIPLQLAIMGGILDETPEEVAASQAFLAQNADKIGIDVMQMLVAEPQTILAEAAEKYDIRWKDTAELRGNRLLSYGMGRMGNDFLYEDGDTFDERLQRFLEIYKTVKPQKNSNLAPHERKGMRTVQEDLERVTLLPWVKVITASQRPGQPARRYVADLRWQRFFVLPAGLVQQGDDLMLTAGRNEGSKVLQQFVQMGLGLPTS